MKKSIKKIVALGAGLTMLGATIFGAAAADLNQYPSPLFIKDGVFNAKIVVGAKASTEDVLGSIDLASALQTAAVKKVVSTATEVSIPTGVQIDKSGDKLAYGRYLKDVQTTALDKDDLPTLLADAVYDDTEGDTDNEAVSYTQELTLGAANAFVTFEQDDKYAEIAAPYLYVSKNNLLYNYTLSFDEDVEYVNSSDGDADVENTVLEILGNKYTITAADLTSGNQLDKLTLLAGETTVWLAMGDTLSKTVDGTTYAIELTDVGTNEDKCIVKVDGTSYVIEVGQTKAIGTLSLGVTDAVAGQKEATKNICQINLGASKMELSNGNEIKVDGESIDGTNVVFALSNEDPQIWEGFYVEYTPKDKAYLGSGESWTDPVFKAFKLSFEGMKTGDTESIKATSSGSDAELTFLNTDGKEITIPWTYDSAWYLGEGSGIDERIYLNNQYCDFTVSGDATDCEGAQFFYVVSGGEAHLMELKDVDFTDDKVTINDLTYGSEKVTSNVDLEVKGAHVISLPAGAGTVSLNVTNATGGTGSTPALLYFQGTGSGGYANTKYTDTNGIKLSAVSGAPASLKTFEFMEDDSSDTYITGKDNAVVSVNFTWDDTDDEIHVDAPVFDIGIAASAKDFSDSNNDDKWYVTYWGTTLLYDDKDSMSLDITYPEDYLYGQAFVAPMAAVVTTTSGEGAVELVPIEVGTAMLDTEITDKAAQNLIVVGGPCANSIAAALMGNPPDCAAGFTAGQAMIKLFEQSTGKVSLLVAGYSALDTRRASRVLAKYKDYATGLVGTSVTVKGTTLTDITVVAA